MLYIPAVPGPRQNQTKKGQNCLKEGYWEKYSAQIETMDENMKSEAIKIWKNYITNLPLLGPSKVREQVRLSMYGDQKD